MFAVSEPTLNGSVEPFQRDMAPAVQALKFSELPLCSFDVCRSQESVVWPDAISQKVYTAALDREHLGLAVQGEAEVLLQKALNVLTERMEIRLVVVYKNAVVHIPDVVFDAAMIL